jgi:type VI secretion system protein ImpA
MTAIITTPQIETLLAPISPENPSGESLRFDAVWDDIRKLREADDPTLPQGVWQRELKRADWNGVASVCIDALTSRTKDLQIAAWLTEAWLHLYGFPGVDLGMRLLAGLCRTFWDSVHPQIEEGELQGRLSPVEWAMDKLVIPMKSIAVTAPAGDESSPFGWKDWESGLYLANLAKVNAAAAATAEQRGMISQARFLVSVSLTPAKFFVGLAGEVAGVVSALDELQRVLNEKCGESIAPRVTPLRSVAVAIHSWAAKLIDERVDKGEIERPIMSEAKSPAGESEPFADADDAAAAPQLVVAGIHSRSDAYQRLREASEYLLRTEPHSPVPYLVKRAISWGNMSLGELLEELLHKSADANTIFALLGMKKP